MAVITATRRTDRYRTPYLLECTRVALRNGRKRDHWDEAALPAESPLLAVGC
jgi:hypothetical protein